MKNFLFLVFLLVVTGVCSAETIKLKSGKVVEGKIVEQTADYIKIDTGIGVNLTYYTEEIETTEIKSDDTRSHSNLEEVTKITSAPQYPQQPEANQYKKDSGDGQGSVNYLNDMLAYADKVKKMLTQEVFYVGKREVARITTDFEGTIIEQTGTIPDGIVKEYDKEGHLIQEANFKNNKLEGLTKTYYPAGALAIVVNAVDGKMNGEYKMYHENGKIKVEGMYEAGKPVGTAKMYDKDGNLMKEMKTGL